MTTGAAGVGANDAQLRVNGRPPGGWLTHHESEHPDVMGTYTDECPLCRHAQRVREVRQAETALSGAQAKVEKQRSFLLAAEESVEQYEFELGQARERAAAAEAEARREVSDDGVVSE